MIFQANQPKGTAVRRVMRLGICVVVSAVALNCAPRKTTDFVMGCVLPADQTGTLSGKWKIPPVPIAFHEGDFSAAEINVMVEAASTWNEFYSSTLSLATIDYGTPAAPRMSSIPRPNNSMVCSGSLTQGNGYTGPVVIYKNGVWPFPSQPNAMALTSYCRGAGNPLPYFYMATLDLNYQNFFVAGQKQPDLQTIVLHELGHLVGLNHSCESAGGKGVPACGQSGLSKDYISAVMFPVFSFNSAGQGEQKRVLTDNDQGRANCLYQDNQPSSTK